MPDGFPLTLGEVERPSGWSVCRSKSQEHQLPGSEDGSQSLGNAVRWNLFGRVEEPCVVLACLFGQCLDAC